MNLKISLALQHKNSQNRNLTDIHIELRKIWKRIEEDNRQLTERIQKSISSQGFMKSISKTVVIL